MDAERFDRLVKGLGTGTDRRRVLGMLTGSLAAVLGGRQITQAQGGNSACDTFCHTVFAGRAAGHCTAAAARGEAGNLCAACGADPTKVCIGEDGEPTCDCCSAGGADCTTGGDAACCSGICVDGTCQEACSAENDRCDGDSDCCQGGTCTNRDNGVGVCCASGTACGTTCCNQAGQVCDAEGACCTRDARDTTCAGRCGTVTDNCDQQEVCGDTCTAGTTPACCGGFCADTDSDVQHCGGCFNTCDTSSVQNATAVACSGGKCWATACQSGFSVVAGACCPTERTCGTDPNLTCCDTGERCCSDGCTDISVDPNNCSGCGRVCPENISCAGSRCGQGAFGGVCGNGIACTYTHQCGDFQYDSCIGGECCIPSGVSCVTENYTFFGACCCDPSQSCPSVGTCP